MPAEQHYGEDSVWVTKTHYPTNQFNCFHYADKIIYISRNPIDVLPSYANIMSTSSHIAVSEKPWNEYKDFWPVFVKYLSKAMAYHHDKVVE